MRPGFLFCLSAKTSAMSQVIRGVVRVGARTKEVLARLRPGEIAAIHHPGLDGVAALALARRGVAAVLNAGACASGRYRNLGPEVLLRAGVPVIERLGPRLLELRDGVEVEVRGGEVRSEGQCVSRGRRLRGRDLPRRGDDVPPAELHRFFANTVDYARVEAAFYFDPPPLPAPPEPVCERTVVVVVRGPGCEEDLDAVLGGVGAGVIFAGVDGGADLLQARGIRADWVIGDMDSVSDQSLRAARWRVVHAFPDGVAPGLGRLRSLALACDVCRAPGTSEDVALLLADRAGAGRVVIVGGHRSPHDFLEKGRAGMAGTLLARMRLGPRLIDARGWHALRESPARDLPTDVICIVPARNEADRVGRTVLALRGAFSDRARVIVVDDASSDGTAPVAGDAGAEVVRLHRQAGKGAAISAALDLCRAPQQVVVLADADLGDSAAALSRLAQVVAAGECDLALGVLPHEHAGGGFGLLARGARAALAALTGHRFRQPLSGQRAIRRGVLERLRPLAPGFGLEAAMLADAVRSGLRVEEYELPLRHRVTGRSLREVAHRAIQACDVARALLARACARRAPRT